MRLYLAGPSQAVTEGQRLGELAHALEVAGLLLMIDHSPYVPGLTRFIDREAGPFSADFWERERLVWLGQCEGLVQIGNGMSDDRMRRAAEGRGLKVYQGLDHLPPAADPMARVRLTPREREVVPMMVAGFSDREIGEYLGIHYHTAGVYVGKVLTKLNCSRRDDIQTPARRAGYLYQE